MVISRFSLGIHITEPTLSLCTSTWIRDAQVPRRRKTVLRTTLLHNAPDQPVISRYTSTHSIAYSRLRTYTTTAPDSTLAFIQLKSPFLPPPYLQHTSFHTTPPTSHLPHTHSQLPFILPPITYFPHYYPASKRFSSASNPPHLYPLSPHISRPRIHSKCTPPAIIIMGGRITTLPSLPPPPPSRNQLNGPIECSLLYRYPRIPVIRLEGPLLQCYEPETRTPLPLNWITPPRHLSYVVSVQKFS